MDTSDNLLTAKMVDQMVTEELARRRLSDFTLYTMPSFDMQPHHERICAEIDAVIAGETRFLYIGMPPRHGKSELSSIRLPALYLGLFPERQIIHISYASSLSNEFSRQVRELIRDSERYKRLFPRTKLSPERARLDDWKTTRGGGFMSVGVGGGVTGHGAHLVIIDDPLKEGDEQSPATLEAVWNWYLSAPRTRLYPGGAVVMPMTRWHPLDPAGRVLAMAKENPQADQWRALVLPALALEGDALGRAPGEALWSNRYSVDDLLAMKVLSERYFEAMFQQDPRPADTVLFREEGFEMVERVEHVGKCAWCFDLALTEGEASDYTSFGRWSYDGARLRVSNLERHRLEWPAIKRLIIERLVLYPEDDFVFPRQLIELLAVQELKTYRDYANRIREIKLPGDKRARAAVFADRVETLGCIVENSTEGRYFAFEHVNYGALQHDDCIDQSSVATHWYGLHEEFSMVVRAPVRKNAYEEAMMEAVYGQNR